METIDLKDKRGFTLIETCVALLLLMIVIAGVLPVGIYALKYNSLASIRAGAVTAAQRKLEQLRATPFTSVTTSSEVVSIGPSESQSYTVAVTVTDVTATMKNITIVVTPRGKSTAGVYSGNEGWLRGQVVVYTKRTTSVTGANLG